MSGDVRYIVTIVALYTLGLAVTFVGSRAGGSAARLAFPSANELLAADERAPVLYLRSFHDDDLAIHRRTTEKYAERNTYSPQKAVNLELAIADQLVKYGPLIAIGRPSETKPNLAAARAYFDDTEWQDAAQQWIDSAALIVMLAGKTEGVRWELDRIVHQSHDDKLLVLFPPYRRGATERTVVLEVFGINSEEVPLKRLMALCRFGTQRLILLYASKFFEKEYEQAICLASYSLFYEQSI
ncbi:MAG: hypothetical protein KDE53_31675 [Caldilineaceae bacterium]|nr:hypothetical protein [Caldilineaceae bacterium]